MTRRNPQRRRRWTTLVVVHVAALAAGIAAATVGLVLPDSGRAFAANHCTRYAPVLSQDVNCNLWGTIVGDNVYQTPSTALRDSNRISMGGSRPWVLCYVNDLCVSGSGSAGLMGDSDGFRVARCYQTGANVQGRCRTDWHN